VGKKSGKAITTDLYTAKYASLDGHVLWEKQYLGSAGGNEASKGSQSLAPGPNGMIVVTGFSYDESGSDALVTILYRERPSPVSILRTPTGVRLRFEGDPEYVYRIEQASQVAGSWRPIGTPSSPVMGIFEYDATFSGQQVYFRIALP
jgi:hypothetical protein